LQLAQQLSGHCQAQKKYFKVFTSSIDSTTPDTFKALTRENIDDSPDLTALPLLR